MGKKRAYKSRKPGGGRKKLKPEYDAGKNLKEQMVRELAEIGIECEPVRVDDYTGKKMTFFHDPDGLPLELHE